MQHQHILILGYNVTSLWTSIHLQKHQEADLSFTSHNSSAQPPRITLIEFSHSPPPPMSLQHCRIPRQIRAFLTHHIGDTSSYMDQQKILGILHAEAEERGIKILRNLHSPLLTIKEFYRLFPLADLILDMQDEVAAGSTIFETYLKLMTKPGIDLPTATGLNKHLQFLHVNVNVALPQDEKQLSLLDWGTEMIPLLRTIKTIAFERVRTHVKYDVASGVYAGELQFSFLLQHPLHLSQKRKSKPFVIPLNCLNKYSNALPEYIRLGIQSYLRVKQASRPTWTFSNELSLWLENMTVKQHPSCVTARLPPLLYPRGILIRFPIESTFFWRRSVFGFKLADFLINHISHMRRSHSFYDMLPLFRNYTTHLIKIEIDAMHALMTFMDSCPEKAAVVEYMFPGCALESPSDSLSTDDSAFPDILGPPSKSMRYVGSWSSSFHILESRASSPFSWAIQLDEDSQLPLDNQYVPLVRTSLLIKVEWPHLKRFLDLLWRLAIPTVSETPTYYGPMEQNCIKSASISTFYMPISLLDKDFKEGEGAFADVLTDTKRGLYLTDIRYAADLENWTASYYLTKPLDYGTLRIVRPSSNDYGKGDTKNLLTHSSSNTNASIEYASSKGPLSRMTTPSLTVPGVIIPNMCIIM